MKPQKDSVGCVDLLTPNCGHPEKRVSADEKELFMEEYTRPSEEEILQESIAAKLQDLNAGLVVDFDPDEAEALGYCPEDALDLEDALDSRYDRDDPYASDGGNAWLLTRLSVLRLGEPCLFRTREKSWKI